MNEKIKVLNLYAGIGGNRKLWPNDKIEVTAVEIEPKIAKIYQDFFPNDKVIVADAHQFLLDHFKEFDFIWSSPPCPSHSKFRFMTTKMEDLGHKRPIIYPDMSLYQEIILLNHYFKGYWVVENVQGYYEPLIEPFRLDRHYFWSNFNLIDSKFDMKRKNFIKSHSQNEFGFDIRDKDCDHRKDQIIHNLVSPELGLHIFNMAFKDKQKSITEMLP